MSKPWTAKPALAAPGRHSGWLAWLRANLFSSLGNTCLTLLGLAIIVMTLPPFLHWSLFNATWLGDTRGVCDAAGSGGACWVFVKVRLEVFLYGFYPEAERWRVNFAFILLATTCLPFLAPSFFASIRRQLVLFTGVLLLILWQYGTICAGIAALYLLAPFAWRYFPGSRPFTSRFRHILLTLAAASAIAVTAAAALYGFLLVSGAQKAALPAAIVLTLLLLLALLLNRLPLSTWQWLLLFTVYPLLALFLLLGGVFGLPVVETHFWGGLFLTLTVAISGMATALPLGILLALGRRSTLPVIKTLCVSFIEFVRGVPLVSVLFMASVMFPLFLPENVSFDKLLRALIGVAFFYAAYMAEVVRGGLQAIPKGQYEAALALGWNYWKMMSLIILPQALRLIIPGLANNFLSLLKDTTLVAVIGLLDLLGVAKASMADAEWLGFTKEAYVFAGVVFWLFCFAISRYSVYLEKKYHTSYH